MTRMQLNSVLTGSGYLGQDSGLDFLLDFVFGGNHFLYPLLSMGRYSSAMSALPFVATPPQATATSNTTNQQSVLLHLTSSVWNGSSAQFRPAILSCIPGSGVNNAPAMFSVAFYISSVSWGTSYRIDCLTVDENGKFFFGQNTYGVTIDPTAMTAKRTVTWPDINGGNMVVVAGAAPASNTAAATPGTIIYTAANNALYVCHTTNSWVKVATSTTVP